jgi:hypothetical protein
MFRDSFESMSKDDLEGIVYRRSEKRHSFSGENFRVFREDEETTGVVRLDVDKEGCSV